MEAIFGQQREWRQLFIMYLTSIDKVDKEKNHTIKKYLKYINNYRRGEVETNEMLDQIYNLCSNYFNSATIYVIPLGTCEYIAGITVRMNRISIKELNKFWANTSYPFCIRDLIELFLGTDINAFHSLHRFLEETLNTVIFC